VSPSSYSITRRLRTTPGPRRRRTTVPVRPHRGLAAPTRHHRHPLRPRPDREPRGPPPRPRLGGRPHPLRQEHRPGPLPLPRVRHQRCLARTRPGAIDLLSWTKTMLLPANWLPPNRRNCATGSARGRPDHPQRPSRPAPHRRKLVQKGTEIPDPSIGHLNLPRPPTQPKTIRHTNMINSS
jgi:hypothetical protein